MRQKHNRKEQTLSYKDIVAFVKLADKLHRDHAQWESEWLLREFCRSAPNFMSLNLFTKILTGATTRIQVPELLYRTPKKLQKELEEAIKAFGGMKGPSERKSKIKKMGSGRL